MGRQFAIALASIVLALIAISVTVIAGATWLQRRDDDPPAPPRVATAFGQVASLVAGDVVLLDDSRSPAMFGPATVTLAGGAPLEVPPATPLYGTPCDLVRLALEAPTTPILAGSELVTPELPPCHFQVGVGADGRVAWLLGFASGADGLTVNGDLRGVQAELLVLEDGSTVPGAATAPLTGCEALAVTTIAEVAALDTDVEIRVDPTTGAALDVSCTF